MEHFYQEIFYTLHNKVGMMNGRMLMIEVNIDQVIE